MHEPLRVKLTAGSVLIGCRADSSLRHKYGMHYLSASDANLDDHEGPQRCLRGAPEKALEACDTSSHN